VAGSVRSGSGYALGLLGGGGGTTDHAALSNLTWTVSAHIGTAGSLALFDGAGAAAYLTGVTQGDVVYFDGTNWNRLPPGTSGEFLQTQGAGANPQWAPASVSTSGALRTIRFAIGTAATTDSVTAIPAGSIVSRCQVSITTPYSAGATIEVGDTGGTVNLYMTSAQNDPQLANLYGLAQDTNGVAATVRATIGGAPVAGAGFVSIWYSVPNP